jgi:hypothetical protein
MTTTQHQITIRPAYGDDQLALIRLAALDSADGVPASPLLVAEVDGELRVALSLVDGSAIADPFARTADVLELLERHAAGVRRARSRRPRRRYGLRLAGAAR